MLRLALPFFLLACAFIAGTAHGTILALSECNLSNSTVYFLQACDFVEDPLPEGQHSHGTHITSLITSEGSVQGVKATAKVYPVRVLDGSISPAEKDLSDCILHAIDSGESSLVLPPFFVESSGSIVEA